MRKKRRDERDWERMGCAMQQWHWMAALPVLAERTMKEMGVAETSATAVQK